MRSPRRWRILPCSRPSSCSSGGLGLGPRPHQPQPRPAAWCALRGLREPSRRTVGERRRAPAQARLQAHDRAPLPAVVDLVLQDRQGRDGAPPDPDDLVVPGRHDHGRRRSRAAARTRSSSARRARSSAAQEDLRAAGLRDGPAARLIPATSGRRASSSRPGVMSSGSSGQRRRPERPVRVVRDRRQLQDRPCPGVLPGRPVRELDRGRRLQLVSGQAQVGRLPLDLHLLLPLGASGTGSR